MGVVAREAIHASRFEVQGTLGSGGMGVVYRALDRRLGHEVALKTVSHASGSNLYRFKREFRSLADIVHPNLVALHELHTSGDEWFISMELVEGVSFIDWVRPALDGVPIDVDVGDESFDPTAQVPVTGSGRTRRDIVDAPLDRERLAAALPQLCDAVLALHLCGKLHRDLKPSNVLVTPEGRVVVLDFGLVSDIEGLAEERTHETSVAVGTPVYTGVRRELNVGEHYLLVVLFYLGEIAELTRRAPELLREAVERGDVYAQHALRGWRPNVAWLFMGRPDDARAHVGAVAPSGTTGEPAADFHLHRFWELSSHAGIDLYLGDGASAWARTESMWRTLWGSHLVRLQSVRIEAAFLRARAALATGRGAEARKMAARLARERAPWADALAELVRARLAGDAARLAGAQRLLTACDMALHAAVVKLRLDEGAGLSEAGAALRARGAADPAAVARMLCP